MRWIVRAVMLSRFANSSGVNPYFSGHLLFFGVET